MAEAWGNGHYSCYKCKYSESGSNKEKCKTCLTYTPLMKAYYRNWTKNDTEEMERECNKCIHHTSGMCSSWDCKMQTVEDVKREAVKEFTEKVVAELEVEKERYENDRTYWSEHPWKDSLMYNECDMNDRKVSCFEEAIEIVRGKE